jgi:hypothetical protein
MQAIRIYTQDLDAMDRYIGQYAFTSSWDLPRKHTYTYFTSKDGEAAAEQAYHIFNAPESMLNDFERHIASEARSKAFNMHSLSVGDVVRVGDEVEYLCASEGWLSRRYA